MVPGAVRGWVCAVCHSAVLSDVTALIRYPGNAYGATRSRRRVPVVPGALRLPDFCGAAAAARGAGPASPIGGDIWRTGWSCAGVRTDATRVVVIDTRCRVRVA